MNLSALKKRLGLGAARAPAGWVALEQGPQGIRALAVRSGRGRNRPQVLGHHLLETGGWNKETLLELAGRINEPSFHWLLVLQRDDYRLSMAERPETVEDAELKDSLRWVVGPTLDYPVDEAVLDALRIPVAEFAPGLRDQVYIVTARADTIEDLAEPFKEAKLPLRVADIRETALRNLAARLEGPDEALGVVAVGGQGVQITFTLRGELYFDRFVLEPLGELRGAGEEARVHARERITNQVRRSIEAVEQRFSFFKVARIVAAPGSDSLVNALTNGLQVPVSALVLGDVFDASLVPELEDEALLGACLPLLGAVLRDEAPAR